MKIPFVQPPDAVKAEGGVYDMGSRQLAESNDINTRDNLIGYGDLVLTDFLYIIQNKAGKANAKYDIFTGTISGTLSNFARR